MTDLLNFAQEIHASFRALNLGPMQRHIILASLVALAFFGVVMVIERACGTRSGDYQSPDFGREMVYWFYYRSGLNYVLVISLLFSPLDQSLSWIDLGLLKPYPIATQAFIFFIVSDFYAYWTHRAFHRFKFLWAIHTMHHAPPRMTFAASAMFHPLEIAIVYVGFYLMVRVSGGNPLAWLPVLIFMEIMLGAQHTRIPWTLGPLYKVLVTPKFHRFHHSSEQAHYDKNFGATLSIWDHLFGTALPQNTPLPQALGVPGVVHTSLWDTLVQPLRMAFSGLPFRPFRKRGPSDNF